MKKRGLDINKLVIFLIVTTLLLSITHYYDSQSVIDISGNAMADGSTVERTISDIAPKPGEIITVTLDIIINGGHTYYAIEETVPVGWVVENDGGGATSVTNSLKWAEIQAATTTTKTYTVTVPSSLGSHTFSGNYFIEDMSQIEAIEGAQNVNVVTSCSPSTEICDGSDNDCDGDVDLDDSDLSQQSCPFQNGVCSGSLQDCGGSSGWLTCTSSNYGSDYETPETSCDGEDNDCDGQEDNDLTPPTCTLQSGVCFGAVKDCGGSSGWITCTSGNYGSNYEVEETKCDNEDNDCDGEKDEDCDCTTGDSIECGTSNIGTCSTGNQTCTDGQWSSCVGSIEPTTESCDGLDNDCDGSIDNNAGCTPDDDDGDGGSGGDSSGGSGGGSGGGGSGGGSGGETEENTLIEKIIISSGQAGASKPFDYTQEIDIQQIDVSFTNNVGVSSITIEKLTAKPTNIPTPTSNVYSYISITKDLQDRNVESSKIKFKVPRVWFSKNGVLFDELVLKRLILDAWQDIETTQIDSDTDYYYYESGTQDLTAQYYAIGKEEKVIDEIRLEQQTSESDVQNTKPISEEKIIEQSKKGLPWLFLGLGLLVLLLIALLLVLKKIFKKEDIKEDKEFEEFHENMIIKEVESDPNLKKLAVYIKKKTDKGLGRGQITMKLMTSGWDKDKITKAFEYIREIEKPKITQLDIPKNEN